MGYKRPVSIEVAVRIYWQYPEIGNKEIKELFGRMSSDTIVRHKAAARKVMVEKGVKTNGSTTVNTECAFEAWGIDVEDYERRLKRLQKLKAAGVAV